MEKFVVGQRAYSPEYGWGTVRRVSYSGTPEMAYDSEKGVLISGGEVRHNDDPVIGVVEWDIILKSVRISTRLSGDEADPVITTLLEKIEFYKDKEGNR